MEARQLFSRFKHSPRNTPMALAATTLPIELSAVGSLMAAILLANRSIWDVPKATRVMAVSSLGRPTRQPNILAKSLKTSLLNYWESARVT